MTAYTLVAAKPKLTKADPANRTGCKLGPAPVQQENAAMGLPSMLATCRNMTMAQFAEQLQTVAQLYIHSPVVDATGIDGAWDFSLTFSLVPPNMAGMVRAPGGRGGDAAPPASGAFTPSDPSGAVTIFNAIEKQLGLKLEAQKRPTPVLVIDHVEEKPTDN